MTMKDLESEMKEVSDHPIVQSEEEEEEEAEVESYVYLSPPTSLEMPYDAAF